MADLVPSLHLLFERVRAERSELRQHAESLDSKAGFVLGIAGLLATVVHGHARFSLISRLASGLAASLCVGAMFPRPFAALHLRELRSQYLTQPEDLSRLDLLDTDIEMHMRDAVLLRRKVNLLKLAMVAFLTGVLVFLAGIISS